MLVRDIVSESGVQSYQVSSERVLMLSQSQGVYFQIQSGVISKTTWHLELWFLYATCLLKLVYSSTEYHQYI